MEGEVVFICMCVCVNVLFYIQDKLLPKGSGPNIFASTTMNKTVYIRISLYPNQFFFPKSQLGSINWLKIQERDLAAAKVNLPNTEPAPTRALAMGIVMNHSQTPTSSLPSFKMLLKCPLISASLLTPPPRMK